MQSLLLFERDFRPEDHGWYVSNPVVPQDQLGASMQELRRFGFVSTTWARWEVPYERPAVLVVMGLAKPSGRYYGLYMPPFERDSLSVSVSRIHRELRSGTGGGIVSPRRPFVSH
ncbi:hypothetical protein AB0M10_15330 [Streptomyces sp. NPDC051840]|uniref:hypothetical protein n=1 Tax=Streptomyces sp. NPDC051840 TaxID=3154752 RepID=UPI00341CB977